MYEELIKKLRNRRICIQQSGNLDDFPLLGEAADAIEELQKQCDAWEYTAANEMSYKEAADRIEDHMHVHHMQEGWHCEKITEALKLAVETLRCLDYIQKGGELMFLPGGPIRSGNVVRNE